MKECIEKTELLTILENKKKYVFDGCGGIEECSACWWNPTYSEGECHYCEVWNSCIESIIKIINNYV